MRTGLVKIDPAFFRRDRCFEPGGFPTQDTLQFQGDSERLVEALRQKPALIFALALQLKSLVKTDNRDQDAGVAKTRLKGFSRFANH